MFRRGCIFAAAGALVASAVAGPTSEWFISDGNSRRISVVQGSSVVRSWIGRDDAMTLAVINTVRTYGEYHTNFGSEYKLDGTWTGVDYPYQGGPADQRVDGGTDGVSRNFEAAWNDGGIWQYTLDWKNPQRLFSANGPTGVTYDLKTGNLWVIEYGTKRVVQYTTAGAVVSAFPYTTGSGWLGCLAYEPATDTLWAEEFNTGRIYQFDKNGNVLQTEVISALAGYAWGGEFVIPEPGALLLAAVGLLLVIRRR